MSDHLPISSSNKSIVVLPFVNMSVDPENEYYSDGITEEIINALTTVKGLKVIARTSSFAFKNKNLDVRTIGDQLGVSTILEGSVRKAKNRIRITVQLVSTNDGTHFWSKTFNRDLDDIFAIQDEISLRIADQIRENFGHLNIQEHLIKEPTKNIEAYNLYLKGRYQHLMWDGPGIAKATELYEQSVAKDPSFALPYFGLAYCYAMSISWRNNKGLLQMTKEKLSIGFNLDKQSFVGYFSKATLSFWSHWDFVNGHKYFQKAIELLKKIKEKQQMIIVYTDYDADGITGGAILWETLYLLGFKTMPYVPHRKNEGYGFSIQGIDNVISKYHPALIISVDHGISAAEKISYAKKKGIPIIVTDHHLAPKKLPKDAFVIFHIPALSGAGVAYIFAKEIFERFKSLTSNSSLLTTNYLSLFTNFSYDYLALAATGIVADLVPLIGPARSIVKFGLDVFPKASRI